MSMTEWAKEEINLAIEKEKSVSKSEKDAEYGIAVYEAALAGFLEVFNKEPGLTGTMVGFVSEIINRLFHGQPLTPIENTPDGWEKIGPEKFGKDGTYQCKRMSSLFKYITIDKDGNEQISYNDVDRVHGYDINSEHGGTYHAKLLDIIIGEMFPIKMPYMPATGSIRVYTEDFKYNKDLKGDLDTIGVLYAKIPGYIDPIKIMRFFREPEANPPEIEETAYPNCGWVEIQQDEYMKRKTEWFKRVQNEKTKKGEG